MLAARTCRHCGTAIGLEAPFGHCPGCLIKLGFCPVPDEALEAKPGASPGGRQFGNYELIEQIGRGGMGVVYRAEQITVFRRQMALKMILAGELASAASIERFHIEADAASRLQHPNIVK